METMKRHWGKYRGVGFEIQEKHGYMPWAYYIHICADNMINKELAEEAWGLKGYMECDNLMNNVDMHGGCTYTNHSVVYGNGKEYRMIKLGCDYGHYWDDDSGDAFSVESILVEVMQSIDCIHNIGYKTT